jgi:hypothetical protein
MNLKPNPLEKNKETGQVCPSGPVTDTTSDVIVAPATPSSIQARSFVPRRRFQKGNIIIRGKTPTLYGMYREDVLQSDGTFSVCAGVWFLALSAVCQSVQHGRCFNRILTA